MRFQRNPAYRSAAQREREIVGGRPTIDLPSWIWTAALVVVVVIEVILGHYVQAAVILGLSVAFRLIAHFR
jgi:hypothetical protein